MTPVRTIDDCLDPIATTIEALPRPAVFGVAGGVGAGKTTFAERLAEHLRTRGLTAHVLGTDNFLLSNADLSARGLLMRKGFPDTFDVDALLAAVADLRAGRPATVPVYDHATYDRLPSPRVVDPCDVLVLEGVNVLQDEVAAVLDLSLYIEAHEPYLRAWFYERFDGLCERGEGFYAPLATMGPAERRAMAEAAWVGVNLVNLEQHIEPTKRRAHLRLQKNADHSVRSLGTVGPRPEPRGGRS